MTRDELIRLYKEGRRDFRGADLMGADLSGADLSGADLLNITLCGATIDGAILDPDDIGGPGHILYALTTDEAGMIEEKRRLVK